MLSALACTTAALQAQAMKVNFSPDDSSRLGIAASMIYNSNSKSNSNSCKRINNGNCSNNKTPASIESVD